MTNTNKPIEWRPSPEPFDCECGAQVTTRNNIMWLMGVAQLICIDCALKVLRDHLEVIELEEIYNAK